MRGVSGTRFDMSDEATAEQAYSAATLAIHQGKLVVFPTDTLYGVAADAFSPAAIADLLAAKGRGREMPPPVLVSTPETLEALTSEVPAWAHALVEEFWPGPLTLVCREQASLTWDLGETAGTVAVRMPDNEIALTLLKRTGPLAVSSANLTGMPAATTADQASDMLLERVAVLLDGGSTAGEVASTIVDCTREGAWILREGVIEADEIRRVVLAAGGHWHADEAVDGDDSAEVVADA
jgi:tRNA threonylcarbamoyl adenosine modification protein (Sua5/YciO/YrdC/YwlC family)